MMDSATNDFSQHVTAAFIRRDHAIVDQKSSGAGMVGDNAQGSGAPAAFSSDSSFREIHVTEFCRAFN